MGAVHKEDASSRGHYLCNNELAAEKAKLSWAWRKVTCKNCLKRRER